MFKGFRSRCTMFCRCAAPTPAPIAQANSRARSRRHHFFFGQNVLQRLAVYKLHHQKRHRAAHDAKVRDRNNVLMTDGRGGQRFLAKTRNQHRIVADEIRQDHFDGVRSFEKDVPRLKDDAHAALAQSPFQLVAGIEYGFAKQRWRGGIAVLRTVVDFVRETAPTGWTFFHLLARSSERRQEGFRLNGKIAVAGDSNGCAVSKQPTNRLYAPHLRPTASLESMPGL